MVVFDMRQFQAGNNTRLLFDALAMHQMQQSAQQPLPLPQEQNQGGA
jgi:hypothetical protein